MGSMRVDHVSYAAEHDGAKATAERLGELIGVPPVEGGNHPRFGTLSVILPLMHQRYVEVVEVLDHPASYKARSARSSAPAPRRAVGGLAGSSPSTTSTSTRNGSAASRRGATATAPTVSS